MMLLCWKPTLSVLISHPQGSLGVQLCPSGGTDRPILPVLCAPCPVIKGCKHLEELRDCQITGDSQAWSDQAGFRTCFSQ